MRCRWCCNPESIHPQPEILFNPDLCIGCGMCIRACPTGATKTIDIDRSLCTGCGKCVQTCYAEAKYLKGEYVTPKEVLDIAIRDASFYARTGGGVTFSGGEPLLQVDFLEETLSLCKKNGIGTAIETCGYVPWEHFVRIAPFVDVFLFDIKSTDSDNHLAYTGVRCERIMENCERLSKVAKRLVIRVPAIPSFNFDVGSLTKIVRFAEKIGVAEINFLPYHRFAAKKYTFLGREYWNPGIERLDDSAVKACIEKIKTPVKLRING